MIPFRTLFVVLFVFSLTARADDESQPSLQGRYGTVGISESEKPSLGERHSGKGKPRKRMSPGQSVSLSSCERNRDSCVCPSGYMKLEGVEGQLPPGSGSDKVLRVDQMRQFKRVIQCVKPCSDGSVPAQEMGTDGKLKSKCTS